MLSGPRPRATRPVAVFCPASAPPLLLLPPVSDGIPLAASASSALPCVEAPRWLSPADEAGAEAASVLWLAASGSSPAAAAAGHCSSMPGDEGCAEGSACVNWSLRATMGLFTVTSASKSLELSLLGSAAGTAAGAAAAVPTSCAVCP